MVIRDLGEYLVDCDKNNNVLDVVQPVFSRYFNGSTDELLPAYGAEWSAGLDVAFDCSIRRNDDYS